MDDILSRYIPILADFHRVKNETEMVNQILNPPAIGHERCVTNVQLELWRVFGKESSATALLPIKDNLERIRVFKDRWLDKIKLVLTKELFSKREWIGLLSKNESVADLLRKKGNEYFSKKDFEMAFRAYTLAGMYAPKDSKSLALSYSNRSACFVKTKRWNKCLEDIKSFERIWNKIEEGPTPTADNVAKRKQKCLEEIRDNKEDISLEKKFGTMFFKLKNPSADSPSLEDFLGVKADPKKGRGIYNISDETIEPGTLIMLDAPYSHCFDTFSFQTINCSGCYRFLDGYGIPCGGCVFNLYCSEACAASDQHKIHVKYECKLTPYLFEVLQTERYTPPNRYIHTALRVLLKLGPNALLDHYRQVFSKRDSTEDGKYGNIFASYLPIYNLIYHEEMLSEEKVFEYSKYAVILTEILDFCTDYFTCLSLDDLEAKLLKEEFARRLLFHQMCIKVNAYTIGYFDLPKGRSPTRNELLVNETLQLGTGVYPAVSLINHSCSPNAKWLHIPGGVMAVVAVEYIVPGQEILTNYVNNFCNETRENRRIDMLRRFGFQCECEACMGNWTTHTWKKSSEVLGAGCICPKCRMKCDVSSNLHMKYVPSKQLYVCSGKCGFQILRADLEKKFSFIGKLGNAAMKCLDEYKILKAFMDAKKCVQYYDAHFPKPNEQIAISVVVMTSTIELIARKMLN